MSIACEGSRSDALISGRGFAGIRCAACGVRRSRRFAAGVFQGGGQVGGPASGLQGGRQLPSGAVFESWSRRLPLPRHHLQQRWGVERGWRLPGFFRRRGVLSEPLVPGVVRGCFFWHCSVRGTGLHRIAREFNVRLEEHVHERTRIACGLHDTLLQSFRELTLRFQTTRNLLPRASLGGGSSVRPWSPTNWRRRRRALGDEMSHQLASQDSAPNSALPPGSVAGSRRAKI